MNLLDERDSFGMSIQPAKRRRGRPRKHPIINQAEATRTPGSEGGVAYPSHRANRGTRGMESMVGQAVTGIIEASFDSGYLLSVRIGNSSTSLRGVVFKPGHCAPITAENDIAPHAHMIRRSNVHFPVGNHSRSPAPRTPMHTSAVEPSKRKHLPPVTTPVAPQPVIYPNGLQTDNRDADVHMVEPLSMLPPSQPVPAGPVFMSTQPHPIYQVPHKGQACDDGSFNKGISTETETKGSLQTSDTKIQDAEESLESTPENSDTISEQYTEDANDPLPVESSRTEPLFNYGTGRMTELLKALQENSKENPMQIVEQPTAATQVQLPERMIGGSFPNNQGYLP